MGVKGEVKMEVKMEVKGEVKLEVKGEVKMGVKLGVKGEVKLEVKGDVKGDPTPPFGHPSPRRGGELGLACFLAEAEKGATGCLYIEASVAYDGLRYDLFARLVFPELLSGGDIVDADHPSLGADQ